MFIIFPERVWHYMAHVEVLSVIRIHVVVCFWDFPVVLAALETSHLFYRSTTISVS